MSLSLEGKVVIVTGAGAGLGRAEALALAAEGASVVVNDVSHVDTADEIEALGGKAVFVQGDVGERATADELLSAAEGLGGLHVGVDNPGPLRDRMLFNLSDQGWGPVIPGQPRGPFLLSRHPPA